jgi:hypothetical protein
VEIERLANIMELTLVTAAKAFLDEVFERITCTRADSRRIAWSTKISGINVDFVD